ncbi:ornithine--oxo-acid aminotransferase [candidate division WOR_3 bacterium SM23_60]|uniref:ornithine aminotransferase n=1 Tax=candidate division WOR_3 bacterium SM23_60 TaxID=1703780 RepID=A0A0S8G9K3_UNCW3|nr:MAG: ornithine--oxo-acid aminotransferase [candidate division WOR_3 bacterium SM23_60]
MKTNRGYIKQVDTYSAHNYHPLPVVLCRGKGIWVWDVEGNRYLDMLSAYSALNQGHCHPQIVKALKAQAGKLSLTSRAFHNDQMGVFLQKLCVLTGYQKALPMNSGAEAVETSIKVARKWGYYKKGVQKNRAQIIVCKNNFHGRTTTIVGFSSEKQYRDGFGPFTPGFMMIPYNDAPALEKAITKNTVGFLIEPLQGEGGVIVPDNGYLKACARICKKHNVLLIDDEIQTGLGRTGKLFASDYERVRPDIITIGKALSGGLYPVSAILCDHHIMEVLTPGDHGSTFGGNPIASAVGIAALDVIIKQRLPERAFKLGNWFMQELKKIKSPLIREIRGKGLLVGVELKKKARPYCEALMKSGILAKETHEMVVRFAPPLVITKKELSWALPRIADVLKGKGDSPLFC